MAGVELRGLAKVFPNGVEAVSGVDLTVERGRVPRGRRAVGVGQEHAPAVDRRAGDADRGLDPRSAARDVTALPPRDRDVAMVFQDPALFPYLSVFENLAFGLRARGVGGRRSTERVEAVAGLLGLAACSTRRPATLSGGQRQRVALGRAVVRRPAVFLLDEPLSSLDAPLRAAIRAELIDLHRRLGATMILRHPRPGRGPRAGRPGRRAGRGRIVQAGTPVEVYERPGDAVRRRVPRQPADEHPPVRGRGRRRRRFASGLNGRGWPFPVPDGPMVRAARGRRGAARVDLGLRPEHVRLSRVGDAAEPGVDLARRGRRGASGVESLGHETIVTLGLGPHDGLDAGLPGPTSVRPGEAFDVGVDLDRVSWFDPATGAAIASDPSARDEAGPMRPADCRIADRAAVRR